MFLANILVTKPNSNILQENFSAFDLEFGSAIPAAAVIAFVFAFQIGLGPLSWIRCRTQRFRGRGYT